jgi:transposase
MAFIRKTKKKDGIYLEVVESYRKEGKVKQRFLKYLGREIEGKPVRRVKTSDIEVESVKRYGDVLCVDKISHEIGLPVLVSKPILLLAYSHLLDNVSMRNMEEWVKQTEIPEALGLKCVSTKTLYSALEDLDDSDFMVVEESIYKTFSQREKDETVVVVDVTDTYFEGGNGSSSKKRRGKDGKCKNLLQICLAVTLKHGFPVMHKTYDGNVSGVRIFQDMVAELKTRGLESIIVDRGMHSRDNIQMMQELRMKLILGARKTREIKRDFLYKLVRDDIYRRDTRIVLNNTTVHAKSFPYLDGNLVVVYNPELEVHQKENHYARGGTDEDAKYLGYSLIYHNTLLDETTVVKQYFEKDVIERSFKQIKGVLSLRPVRMWLRNHVNGHVRVCYLSYAILTMLGYEIKDLKISPQEALEKLKTSYMVHLKDHDSDFSWSRMVKLEKIQDQILEKVGVMGKK